MVAAKTAAVFVEEYGVLLELSGANAFRVRAYTNAVRALETLTAPLDEILAAGTLTEVKGIGKSVAELVAEFAETGTARVYEELRAAVPAGLLEMLRVPGLGPRKIIAIREALGVADLDALAEAARAGQLADLKGFGKKTQENILKGIDYIRAHQGRFRADIARASADELLETLAQLPQTERVEVAGSLRRAKETVKDIDFVVSGTDAETIAAAFVGHPEVEEILARGETKSAVRLKNGLQADLRVVTAAQFPYVLHHFTGSKEHNVALRTRAQARGLKINEYGLYRGDALVECGDEAAFYAAMDLAHIPPELREGMGEIAAAEAGALPELITAADIRGMLHVHSTYSDGADSLAAMAAAVRARGYEYLGMADHSQSAAYAGGLKPDAVKGQWEEIDRLNEEMAPFRIFKGIESDILTDGALDYDDDILAQFDYTVVSVHSQFNLDRDKMTDRIVRAIEHPAATIVGHLTGRLLLDREGYEVDIDRIIAAAAEHGVAIEINAHPARLDIDWRHVKKARDQGVSIAINTDAHSIGGLDHLPYGIGIGRKGWLRAEDVPNALDAETIAAWFQN
ncbi:MAG: DNA polymerase/3'-5' exonuclease PolX [Candidatus Latescibacteria bacterium]|nr:DNA polymerase/3'-5' exonuclease PolX [Candidatus Latescibacterota bacterium]